MSRALSPNRRQSETLAQGLHHHQVTPPLLNQKSHSTIALRSKVDVSLVHHDQPLVIGIGQHGPNVFKGDEGASGIAGGAEEGEFYRVGSGRCCREGFVDLRRDATPQRSATPHRRELSTRRRLTSSTLGRNAPPSTSRFNLTTSTSLIWAHTPYMP